jgi:hypothetical protein
VDQRFDVASGKVREHGRLRVDSNGKGTGSARRGEHARRHIPLGTRVSFVDRNDH